MQSISNLEKVIQQELTRLDPGLFLDKEWCRVALNGSVNGYVYYTVKHSVGSGTPPYTVLEWRDGRGPWPLSLTMVDIVRQQEGDIREAVTQATVNNAAKAELARQKTIEIVEEAAREHNKTGGRIRKFYT